MANTATADLYERFGANLREARLAAGLTIEELAEHSGRHPTEVERVEQGRRKASLDLAISLADAVGVAPESLWRTGPENILH